jgi:DNA-binding CsgD family transcriptional regulator
VNQIYTRAALSRREAEVFRLLGDGKTTPEITKYLSRLELFFLYHCT